MEIVLGALKVARWYIFKPKVPFGEILEGLVIDDIDIGSL
jgi:hypothetical protein